MWDYVSSAPPGGQSLGNVLVIRASQNGQVLPVKIRYDKASWSGLSWAVGEIQAGSNPSNLAVEIECISREEEPVTLKAALYRLEYL